LAGKNIKRAGFLWTELVVALGILGILLTCLAISLSGFRRFNYYQMTRQRCISAAQAQLDCIAVTGSAIGDEDFERLWPKLSVSVEKSDGLGQWQGLTLITVKTKAKSLNRDIEVELRRYILPKGNLKNA